MSDDDNGDLATEQIERERQKVYGRHDHDVSIKQNIGNDRRVTRFLDWVLPFLALGALTYFGNKMDKLGDAIVTTNIQIALMIEQNKTMQDGFKDHENRIRTLEGRTFRGVAGYGEDTKEPKRVR